MKKFIFSMFIFLASIFQCHGQEDCISQEELLAGENRYSASFMQEQIAQSKSDAEKIQAYFKLGEFYTSNLKFDSDSADRYYNKALALIQNSNELSSSEKQCAEKLVNSHLAFMTLPGDENRDSLSTILEEARKVLEAQDALVELALIANAIALTKQNKDTARLYLHNALSLAEQSKDHHILSYVHSNLANYYKNADSIKWHLNKSICHFNRIGNKGGIARALARLGAVYLNQEDFDSAAQHFDMAWQIFRKINFTESYAYYLRYAGWKYYGLNRFKKATEIFLEADSICIRNDHQESRAYVLNGLGQTHYIQAYYPDALECWQASLEIFRKLENVKQQRWVNGQLGSLYTYMHEYPSAENYLKESLRLARDLQDRAGISRSYSNLCYLYSRTGDKEKLEKYIDSLSVYTKSSTAVFNYKAELYDLRLEHAEAIAYADSISRLIEDSPIRLAELNYQLGTYLLNFVKNETYTEEVWFEEQKLDRQLAIEIGIERLIYAKTRFEQIKAYIDERADISFKLSELYQLKGDYMLAYDFLDEHKILQDSVFGLSAQRRTRALELAQNRLQDSLRVAEEKAIAERTYQADIAKKKKWQSIFAVVAFFVVIIAIGLFGRLRFIRNSKKILEAEKERSENLLLNILPAEIAEELKDKGEAAARDFDMVSILFTDFKGFTKASEQLSAADLVAEINICFKAFDHIVGRYGIEKIKTIGDAYMAAGGLPVPDKESAMNTVLAGLDMQAFMLARKKEREALGLPAFEMRVGIHTGSVVAGIVGVKKFQYDIWGDTVNTASRMESSGEVGQVNLSASTYMLVKDNSEFNFTSRGKVEAKGKGEMEMYFVQKLDKS